MAKTREGALTALVRRSLALPGAFVDAVRGLGAPHPVAAPAAPPPMLDRLRALVARVAGEEHVPLATYSEVRVYRTHDTHGPRAREPRPVIEALPRGPDALDLELQAAREQLAPLVGELRRLAREVAQAVALRVDRELADVEEALGRLELPRGRKRRLETMARLREALGEARLLRVEVAPAQGRRRDLKRITTLGRRLAALVRPRRRGPG
jgi:hypothetical protein